MLRRGPRRRPRRYPGHLALRPRRADVIARVQPLLDARDDRAGLAYRLPRLHLRLGERDPDERPGRPARLNPTAMGAGADPAPIVHVLVLLRQLDLWQRIAAAVL